MEGTPSEGLTAKHVIAMTLSIEAKVAAAVAMAFAVLSIGAIAREQSEGGTAGPNGYGPTNTPGLSQMSARGSNSSLSQLHGGTDETEVLGLY
jgi:hypothetical protein